MNMQGCQRKLDSLFVSSGSELKEPCLTMFNPATHNPEL